VTQKTTVTFNLQTLDAVKKQPLQTHSYSTVQDVPFQTHKSSTV